MSPQLKNKIRAFVLLTVFLLNTVAGFACSVGVDMGYNTAHHDHEKKGHSGTHSHEHHHTDAGAITAKISVPNDDCCSGQVTAFAQSDKSITHSDLSLKTPVFFIIALTSFFNAVTDPYGFTKKSGVCADRRRRSLYDTNIRIAIQSFQI